MKKFILPEDALEKLKGYDSMLLSSEINEVISLVFPTENQLEEKYKNIKEESPVRINLIKSKIIYTELEKSIDLYLKYLKK